MDYATPTQANTAGGAIKRHGRGTDCGRLIVGASLLVLPTDERRFALADFAVRLCTVILVTVEDLVTHLREHDPFVSARIRQPIEELYDKIVNSPEKFEQFRQWGAQTKLLSLDRTERVDSFGEELFASVRLSVCGEVVLIEFYSAPAALRYLGSIMATVENVPLEAEERAMELLREHASKNQYNTYRLTSTLPHYSEKTRRLYLIRRGFPTLVYRHIDVLHDDEGAYVFELGLCAHAGGYHKGTFAGKFCPTDDVIAHLLSLRADEDGFWKQAHIHLPISSRLGL